MEQIGTDQRTVRYKQVVQVTQIIMVVEEEIEDPENDDGMIWVQQELVLTSNRRPLPVPYSEAP